MALVLLFLADVHVFEEKQGNLQQNYINETAEIVLYSHKLLPFYRHSTPLECGSLHRRFSIDIPPLRGVGSGCKPH